MKKIAFAYLSLAGIVGLPSTALAGSLTPASFTDTIAVGETTSVTRTVTTDETGTGILDVYFLADNTGSMGSVLNNVEAVAGALLTQIDGTFADVNFGVGRYLADPSEGVAPTSAYTLLNPVDEGDPAGEISRAQTAINSWFASGGGDFPEANFFGLQQTAQSGAATPSGVGTGFDTMWRDAAAKYIIWFGDATSHTATINLSDTIAALNAEDVTVLAFNSLSTGSGIDGSGNQASQIVNNTGGTLTNNFTSVPVSDIVDLVLGELEGAAATIDIDPMTMGDTSGLDISFVCTDCEDVPGGESRDFDMSVTGLNSGTYDFDVIVPGVSGAVANDTIIVTGNGGPTTPEPATILGSLVALGLTSALKRKKNVRFVNLNG